MQVFTCVCSVCVGRSGRLLRHTASMQARTDLLVQQRSTRGDRPDTYMYIHMYNPFNVLSAPETLVFLVATVGNLQSSSPP